MAHLAPCLTVTGRPCIKLHNMFIMYQ